MPAGAVFPIIVNTHAGARDVSLQLVEVGEVFVASQRKLFFSIVVPATYQFILAGLRLAVGGH